MFVDNFDYNYHNALRLSVFTETVNSKQSLMFSKRVQISIYRVFKECARLQFFDTILKKLIGRDTFDKSKKIENA